MIPLLVGLLFLAAPGYADPLVPKEPEALVGRYRFEWPDGGPTILDSISDYQGPFTVVLTVTPDSHRTGFYNLEPLEGRHWGLGAHVAFIERSKTVFEWDTFQEAQFLVADDVLYFGVGFHPLASGMGIAAYDLAAQDTIWGAWLEGLGPVVHTQYRHWGFTIQLVEDSLLVIRGREADGDFIEILSRADGRQVAHRAERKW